MWDRLTDAISAAHEVADRLLDHLGPRTIVLTDTASDADRIRDIPDQGATPTIPSKSRKWKRCFSKRLHRERNLIERFSTRTHLRRVATRFDMLAANVLAMIQLASIRVEARGDTPAGRALAQSQTSSSSRAW